MESLQAHYNIKDLSLIDWDNGSWFHLTYKRDLHKSLHWQLESAPNCYVWGILVQ